MSILHALLHPAAIAALVSGTVLAVPARAQPKETPQPAASADSAGLHYQLHFGTMAAGPLLFNDIPNHQLDHVDAIEYGGTVAFLLGTELRDLHRYGLGFSGGMVAQSAARSAGFLTPYLVYEIGHPLVLQARAGYAIGVGSGGYAERYGGFFFGSALRWSFRSNERTSPIGVSLGVGAGLVLATSEIQYSSVFVGPQIEVIYYHGDSK